MIIILILINIILVVTVIRGYLKLEVLESYIDDLYDENMEVWDSFFELEEQVKPIKNKKK